MSFSSRWAAFASGESGGAAGTAHRAALSPLALGYSLGVSAYRSLYRRGILKTESVPCQVVSVGNLTVGGTGKTPFVVALSRELMDRQIKHCVICYGYGAESREPVALASDGRGYTADWRVVGDARKNATRTIISPDIDAPTIYFAQELWYSQSLLQYGFVQGYEAAPPSAPRAAFSGFRYYTNGLRAVLWLSEEPIGLDEVTNLNWERFPGE